MIELEKHIKRNVINGRDLKGFERTLGFKRNELEGHRVLNFGCGGSNIGKELKSEGIKCQVVDVDILPNPHSVHDENFTTEEYVLRREALERKVRERAGGQKVFDFIEEHDRQNENPRFGIDGRNFVQLDGSGKLPFPDNSFDDVFVSWVFHQLPDGGDDDGKKPRQRQEDMQERYLNEFMRVGKRIFIAPVGRRELRKIEKNLLNSEFIIESLTHFGEKYEIKILPKNVERSRENGWTDDGYPIRDLEIDDNERPYSVNSAGCAMVILEKNKSCEVL